MKKNYLNNFRRGLKALTLAMIAGFFALEASAQIIESDPADRPDPSEDQFIGAEAEVTFSIDQLSRWYYFLLAYRFSCTRR